MASKAARLTHKQFHQACECLKKHRQRFLDERPPQAAAAALLTTLAGFPVSENSIADLCEASGVCWEPRRPPPTEQKVHQYNALRAHNRAIKRIFFELGLKVPDSIERLNALFEGEAAVENQEPQPPNPEN